LNVEAELIRGSNGIYEVAVDGRVIASKSFSGFPTEAQVTAAVKEALK
jgi:hypothetical protein